MPIHDFKKLSRREIRELTSADLPNKGDLEDAEILTSKKKMVDGEIVNLNEKDKIQKYVDYLISKKDKAEPVPPSTNEVVEIIFSHFEELLGSKTDAYDLMDQMASVSPFFFQALREGMYSAASEGLQKMADNGVLGKAQRSDIEAILEG